MHLDSWHLLGNLLFLLLLGPPVTAALGARRFLGVYLGGALGAALAFYALSSDALAGASGALVALTVAFVLRAPQGRRPGGLLLLCAAKLLRHRQRPVRGGDAGLQRGAPGRRAGGAAAVPVPPHSSSSGSMRMSSCSTPRSRTAAAP